MRGRHRLAQQRVGAFLLLVVAGFALTVLSGCSDSYPDDLKYAPRTDLLCMERGNQAPGPPPGLDSPGPKGWDQILAAYADKDIGQGKPLLDPKDLPDGFHSDLNKLLGEYYGTPAKPIIKGIEDEAASELRLDAKTLEAGSKLYRRQCLHCHGLSGDGRGPTGFWINPHPRDYRQGVFKFISSRIGFAGPGARRAARTDLLRVLRQGIDGSAMPSFGLLPQEDLEALVSYVIHLSIRGETEFAAISEALQTKPPPKSGGEFKSEDADANTLSDFFGKKRDALLDQWRQSQEIMKPKLSYEDYLSARVKQPGVMGEDDAHAKAVARGFTLFQTSGCLGCHHDYGRKRNYKWETWGTVTRAADLTLGIYRGGRRPIDFFYRIRGGITSCGMSGPPESLLSEEGLWDLVEFVIALPYPAMLESAGVKNKIYAGE